MSDPMTNAEVEDILSSIRRLVSEDARIQNPKPDLDAKPADRLVLTPSLRVEKPVIEEQLDSLEQLQPDDNATMLAADALDFEEDAALDAQAEDTVAEELAAAPEDQTLEDIEPSDPEPSVPERGSPADVTDDPDAIGWAVEAEAQARHMTDSPDNSEPQLLFQSAAAAEQLADEHEVSAPASVQDDLQAWDEDSAIEAQAAEHETAEPAFVSVDREDEARDAEGVTREDAQITDQIETFEDDVSVDLDTADAVAAAPFVHVDLEDTESENNIEDGAPVERESLSDKIAALESLVARDGAEYEPDSAGESESAPVEEPLVQWDDVEAQLSEVPESQAPEVLDAGYRVEAEDSDRGEPKAETSDEGILDEEALRDLVADIVREELQGALGQRITRNVRKLVRREIQRALSAHDLE